MDSIMPTQKGVCYICGREGRTESHHCIHGTANRQIAEREGLKVWLCHECHRTGRHAVHACKQTDLYLEREAQTVWESNYIKDYPYENHAEEAAREAWIRLFGKSYIYD